MNSSFACNGAVANFEHLTGDLEDMRIAIITESFPPDVNGVANCVVRVAENLVRKGHHPLVIAPESAHDTSGADWAAEPGLDRMFATLESKTVWHPVSPGH